MILKNILHFDNLNILKLLNHNKYIDYLFNYIDLLINLNHNNLYILNTNHKMNILSKIQLFKNIDYLTILIHHCIKYIQIFFT